MTAREKIAAFFGRALDAMPETEASAFARRIADEMPTEAEVTVTTDETPDLAAMIAALEARVAALEGAGSATDEAPESSAAAADPSGDPPPPADADTPSAAAADPVSAKLDALIAAVSKLIGMEQAEAETEASNGVGGLDAAPCMDAETVARAEILAPGIAKTGDLKARALDAAYATTDGRRVIDSLLGGKPLASADKDLIFAAAAEVVGKSRAATINNASRVTLDSVPSMRPGPVTPEQINEANARRYGLAH